MNQQSSLASSGNKRGAQQHAVRASALSEGSYGCFTTTSAVETHNQNECVAEACQLDQVTTRKADRERARI
eukprot:871313-Pelagomonas_calceolata.AAC.12